jgi:hypothetical protein
VAREVRDLHLPVARVQQRPGRQQKHGLLAIAAALVEQPLAVALDEALLVGVPRPGLLARGGAGLDRRQGHSISAF